jgi:hypothetical protein
MTTAEVCANATGCRCTQPASSRAGWIPAPRCDTVLPMLEAADGWRGLAMRLREHLASAVCIRSILVFCFSWLSFSLPGPAAARRHSAAWTWCHGARTAPNLHGAQAEPSPTGKTFFLRPNGKSAGGRAGPGGERGEGCGRRERRERRERRDVSATGTYRWAVQREARTPGRVGSALAVAVAVSSAHQ